jgi:hypothetical protein
VEDKRQNLKIKINNKKKKHGEEEKENILFQK